MTDRYATRARAAVEDWEAAGAPLADGYDDSTRRNLRDYAAGHRGGEAVSKQVLRYALHFIEQAKRDAQGVARREAIQARIRARQAEREMITQEMREIRGRLGLMQDEMNAMLALNPGVIHNAEKMTGSYGLDFLRDLLARYRAEAKLRVGVKTRAKA